MTTPAQIEAVAKALKESEYDCCDWDMDTLREAAGIAITAAAEVGDKPYPLGWRSQSYLDEAVAATIERCAQVVYEKAREYVQEVEARIIAAAIRALKEKS